MNSSSILQSLIDAEIAMTGKGYPTARVSISCARTRWTPGRPWTVSLYLNETAGRAEFVGNYPEALTAILALSNAVEGVEPRPREWTEEEIKKTLGVESAPVLAEAAE